MRLTSHNGRVDSSGRHNDRNFESNPEHIVAEKTEANITWNWCGDELTFEDGEKKFYEENFVLY